MAKRQTIWLSTMMVLSLMLIGFYTVNNNVKEVGIEPTQTATDKTNQNVEQKEQAVLEQSDFFVAYHLGESQKLSKKEEELQAVIANDKASQEQRDKAQQELTQLRANEDKIDKVIELVKTEGFPDAIVEMKEDKVNVIVQAQELDNKKAVKIMNLVAKEMGVSARKVIVSAHE
jgi:stage III sporulation protein AH